MGGRRVVVAWTVAAVDVTATLACVGLGLAGVVAMPLSVEDAYVNVVFAVTLPLLGALLVRDARGNRLGPVLLALGSASAVTLCAYAYAQQALVEDRGSLPGGVGVGWLSAWVWTFVVPLAVLGVLWFPTGTAPGPRWRWAALLPLAAWCALLPSQLLWPGTLQNHPVVENPVGWDSPVVDVLYGTGQVLLGLSALAALAAVAARLVRGSRQERLQLRWVLVAAALLAVSAVVPEEGSLGTAGTVLTVLGVPLLPLAIAVSVLRHGAGGVVVVLRRSLVFGVLSVLLLVAYVAVVASVTAVLGSQGDRSAAIAAAAVVAVLAAPLRTQLQGSVDRLVYGDRGDPYAALSSLGHRAAAASGPEELLEDTVAAVATALRSPYVAIELEGDERPAAAAGRAGGPEHRVVLSVHGQEVGRLVVAQRTPREAFAARDLVLLEDLGRHVAVAARAALLSRDLRRSRERIVSAREEERRRIRRDLHDGLGPALAGISFGLDAVRNTARQGGDVEALLEELKSEVSTCLADVRRLVYDLRPPALDQLGLVAALQQYAARVSEGGLAVTVSADALPELPAAVEVAAYRIAVEAVTNSARHSGARVSRVDLSVDDGVLSLRVDDDGRGVPGDARRGVGLAAMEERALELGGTCRVSPREPTGTRVVATLPLRSAA